VFIFYSNFRHLLRSYFLWRRRCFKTYLDFAFLWIFYFRK